MSEYFSLVLAGLLGGMVGAVVLNYFLEIGRAGKAKTLSEPALSSAKGTQQKKRDERLNEIDRKLKRIEDEKLRVTEKKIEKIESDLGALDQNHVRPTESSLTRLTTHLNNLRLHVEEEFRALRDQIAASASARIEETAGGSETRDERVRQPEPVEAPVIQMPAQAQDSAPEVLAVPVGEVDARSPGQIIVDVFDDVDAKTMRRLEKMKLEYDARLGAKLVDLYERDGAYVFVMKDSTAYIHPKPNSPLPRIWERAFPGADSYSRPVRRVYKAAMVRQPGGEYEVLENGVFD